MELVKFLLVHRYSADFLYSVLSGKLGSDGKQNTA